MSQAPSPYNSDDDDVNTNHFAMFDANGRYPLILANFLHQAQLENPEGYELPQLGHSESSEVNNWSLSQNSDNLDENSQDDSMDDDDEYLYAAPEEFPPPASVHEAPVMASSNPAPGTSATNGEDNLLIDRPSTDLVQPSTDRLQQSTDHLQPSTDHLQPSTDVAKSKNPEDVESCPICLDMWSNVGPHRLVALRCGHLFGYSCILKWLDTMSLLHNTCPSCKVKAEVKDIRFIYARKVVAADTTELEALKLKLQDVKQEKIKLGCDLRQLQLNHSTVVNELQQLRHRLNSEKYEKDFNFSLECNVELCKDNEGCRVLVYNSRSYDFYISQKSNNPLYPGYGIRRVNVIDHKPGPFILTHTKCIRDMAYNPVRDCIASVSMGGDVRLSSGSGRSLSNGYITTGAPLWACEWGRGDELHLGGAAGLVTYDIRNINKPLHLTKYKDDPSPVVSIKMTTFGLLTCQLNTVCFLDKELILKKLNVVGPFTNLACDEYSNNKILVSCRPSNLSRARHIVYTLKNTDKMLEHTQSFLGSSFSPVMTRSCLVTADTSAWAAYYSASECVIEMQGIATAPSRTIDSTAILDMAAANIGGETLLAALSNTTVKLYRLVR